MPQKPDVSDICVLVSGLLPQVYAVEQSQVSQDEIAQLAVDRAFQIWSMVNARIEAL